MARSHRNLVSRSFSILGLVFFICVRISAAPQTQNESPRALELDKPIERVIAGDESHSYTVNLAAGQYAFVVADQRGADVLVIVYGTDGTKLFQVDSPNVNHGPEPVSLLADRASTFRIEVKSQTKAGGPYEIKLAELRAATEQDRRRV